MQYYLLDTHAIIWLPEDEERIPAPTLHVLKAKTNSILVSIVSFWEIAIKVSTGKLELAQPVGAIEGSIKAARRERSARVNFAPAAASNPAVSPPGSVRPIADCAGDDRKSDARQPRPQVCAVPGFGDLVKIFKAMERRIKFYDDPDGP